MHTRSVALLLTVLCLAASTQARFIFGLTTDNRIVKVESGAAQTPVRTVQLTGLAAGEQMLAIDFVPGSVTADIASGLFGLSSLAKVYVINTRTGAVGTGTQITTTNNCPSSFDAATSIGFDNNPTNAGLRITTSAGFNYAVTGYARDGVCTTQTAYAQATTAVAYTNPFFGASSTTLFAFNAATNTFGTVTTPSNGGTFTALSGAIGLSLSSPLVAFDAFFNTATSLNTLWGVFTVANVSGLYSIDSTTGLPTFVSRFGSGAQIRSIAISLSDNTVETPFTSLSVSAKTIYRFYAEDPSSVDNVRTLTGFANASESLIGISYQPLASTGYPLYGVGYNAGAQAGTLYRVNVATGALTTVGPINTCNLQGDVWSVDFNPINSAAAIRVIGNSGNNYRITAATGACATDTAITPSGTRINAAAYTNSVSGATTTTLRAIDGSADLAGLGTISPPNDGTFTLSGNLANGYPNTNGLNLIGRARALDITSTASGDVAYASIGTASNGFIGRVDLTANTFFPITAAGLAADSVSSPFSAQAPVLPATFGLIIQNGNTMSIYNTNSTTAVSSAAVTGLPTGQTIIGISLRPFTGQVYALTNGGQLYTINLSPTLGVFLQAAAASNLTGCSLNTGVSYSIDFNPVADRLRVLGSDRTNYRINVDTGACIVDGTISYTDGTTAVPQPAGVAYTNNVANATSTSEYMIDEENNFFAQVTVPNSGSSSVISSLPSAEDVTPLDFINVAGTGDFGFLLNGNVIYTIDLSGQVTSLGTFTSGTGLVVFNLATVFPGPPASTTTTTTSTTTSTTASSTTSTTGAATSSSTGVSTSGTTNAASTTTATGATATTSGASSVAACLAIPAAALLLSQLL